MSGVSFIFLDNYADYYYICCLPSPFLGDTCAGEDTYHLFLLAKVPSSFFLEEKRDYIYADITEAPPFHMDPR